MHFAGSSYGGSLQFPVVKGGGSFYIHVAGLDGIDALSVQPCDVQENDNEKGEEPHEISHFEIDDAKMKRRIGQVNRENS